jgi:hypothetical protein
MVHGNIFVVKAVGLISFQGMQANVETLRLETSR